MTLLLSLLLACGGAQAPEPEFAEVPQPLSGTVCAACGMVVSEEPSPRGQVLHRDGTHAHLCSLGDLRAYLQAPNPHGKAVAVWVEVLPPDVDPARRSTTPLPWLRAEQAHFVVGFERPGTMGRPALSFATAAYAAEAAARIGGGTASWEALLTTPHHEDPAPR